MVLYTRLCINIFLPIIADNHTFTYYCEKKMKLLNNIIDYFKRDKLIETKQILTIEKGSTIVLQCICHLTIEQRELVELKYAALSKKHGIEFMLIDNMFKPVAVINDKVLALT